MQDVCCLQRGFSLGYHSPSTDVQVLDITDHAYEHRGVVFKTLNGLCKSSGVLVGIPIIPSIKNLAFVASGGFGEIFKGHTEDGDLVAIKTIRFFTKQDNPEGQKSFRTEILLYRQVRHRHILPLIGITDPEFSRSSAQMVIPWKANGNLLEYVKRVESPPLTVNRLKILVGVCSALCYLHSHVPVVVHGDLKCANVLVDDDGTPLLADFGLSTVRYHGASLSSAQNAGTLRWMAPELLTGNPPKISRETDAWSFGMLALEIFTGQSPYSDKCDYNVTLSRAQGELPKRPSGHHIVQLGLNQELWTQLRQLWSFSPEKRPKFTDLAPILDRLEARWSPPSPTPTPQKYIVSSH
ncbi:hypothetical protein JAAARDRAFT_132576 [Jaapia argillacea MUCL 33604]|uniref:Protein kinase domain-containing protein n=1 Tax=Jaapia argillacea MUCL 33604 TaxID=933084 RepID=A0A067PYQ7_9AGAM|nr:hypothetical protein JAAARDRAFT_132576 [Jaapia argillacea MUCL 33604]